MTIKKRTINNEVFKSPYTNPPTRCFFETTGVSMTQQQFTQECDINNILRSHDRNGVLEHIHRGKGFYADFSNITDFTDALDTIANAQEEFQRIPSEIREKFQNDAGQFFKFATNPENIEQMREMGLANPAESVAMPADIAAPEATEPPKAQVADQE